MVRKRTASGTGDNKRFSGKTGADGSRRTSPGSSAATCKAPLRGDHIAEELKEIYNGYMVHRRFSFRTQPYNPLLQSCVGNVEEMDQTILEGLNASGKASDILFFLSLLQVDGMERTRFFQQALADTTPTKLRYGTE